MNEGFGFRNFRDFNLAILAKQGWRILRNPKTLMAKIFKARYFPRQGVLQAKVGFTPSYTWRSIHKALWVLRKGGYWRVGNRLDIYVWRETWLPTQNGNRLWSPTHGLEEDARVFELIDHENCYWKEDVVKACFYEFEARQVLALPLPEFNKEDVFYWQGTKSGEFKVSSAYHLINSLECTEPENSERRLGKEDPVW